MKRFCFLVIFTFILGLGFLSTAQAEWYKGNTHAHSFWSDGDTLPEMEAKWYKDHGYDFLAMTDHNTAMAGKRHKPYEVMVKEVPDLKKYLAEHAKAFGPDAMKYIEKDGKKMIVLKNFKEVKKMVGKPGVFLLIQSDEVTDKSAGKQTHVNIINVRENLGRQGGKKPAETLTRIVNAAKKAAKKHGTKTIWHLNHPNWPRYDITPELLASLTDYTLFEVANCIPSGNFYDDKKHWNCEKLWDVANTIRLGKMKAHPLFGIASDDAHNYHADDPKRARPGRGFVMVQADKLETNAIVESITKGDFYCSTGVILKELKYDPKTKTLTVEVDPKENTKYTIEFIGTRRGVSPERSKELPRYSDAVGEVFKKVEGTSGSYTLKGDELYVRAAVRSDRKMERPSAKNGPKTEQAWTQPVGWEQ
ncbi:MAG: hypothetical protein PVH19_00515 [Planctomycetia bacterium]|jgi:hypothetical protein